jgi:hypothetical protein
MITNKIQAENQLENLDILTRFLRWWKTRISTSYVSIVIISDQKSIG